MTEQSLPCSKKINNKSKYENRNEYDSKNKSKIQINFKNRIIRTKSLIIIIIKIILLISN